MKCAVISCIGLGDGLLSLILSTNLMRKGDLAVTIHPFLGKMASLFPSHSFATRDNWGGFDAYDHLFFFYEKSPWMLPLIDQALKQHRSKVTILNPIATPLADYPFWEEGKFDGSKPFADNLVSFCLQELGITGASKEIGLLLPPHVKRGQFPKRIILHPMSSRKGKNWRKESFLALAKKLEKAGYEPAFILTEEERVGWPDSWAPRFSGLVEVAHFIAESGAMVGNDSGIGHLASCLGLPTLTICRSKMGADFWRPAWAKGRVVIPPSWIPNIKGLRLRDKHWQRFVPVNQILRESLSLFEPSVLGH